MVVVAGVAGKDPAQMGLAEDDDVIEAFPTDRADQSLRMPVLPGRPRGYRVIAYAHGCETLRDRLTVGRVTVSEFSVRTRAMARDLRWDRATATAC